jgi:carboxymethylenebutenolidase
MPHRARALKALGILLLGAGIGWLIASRGTPPADAAPTTPSATTHGEWVHFDNGAGQQVEAYVAYPERQGAAPAIIVIHEIFGMTDWEPTVADDYASKGYVAIVPDLLSSRYGSTRALGDSARRVVGTLATADILRDLDATYAYVNALPATDHDNVGVIGFCWGGGTVWQYAAHNPTLKAAVVCYGPLADTTLLNKVEAPVLGVYGENDGRVTNSLPTIARLMQAMGKSFVADSYPGTGHGFLKPGRTGSDTPAADSARRVIDAFFRQTLGAQ